MLIMRERHSSCLSIVMMDISLMMDTSYNQRREFWYLLLLMVLLVVGCTTTTHPGTAVHTVPEGSIVLTDDPALIQLACAFSPDIAAPGAYARGCYIPAVKQIWCLSTDLAACGHELMHHIGLRHGQF